MFARDGILKEANQISFLVENHCCVVVDGSADEISKLLEQLGYARNYKIGLIFEASASANVDQTASSSSSIHSATAAEILTEMLRDPLLMNYSCFVVEVNLMEIHLSLLLSLFKKIIKKRKEFRIILVYRNANQIDPPRISPASLFTRQSESCPLQRQSD